MSLEKMDILQYANFLEKQPVNHMAIAQFNPDAIRRYADLVAGADFQYTDAAISLYHPIYRMPESNICFSRDEHDDEDNYSTPLGDIFSHNKVMPEFGEWVTRLSDKKYAKAIREQHPELDNICTTSLSLYDRDHTINPETSEPFLGRSHMLWIESPTFALSEDFRNSLTLMGSKKRNAMDRILRKTVEAAGGYISMDYEVVFSRDLMDWALRNLNKRFRYGNWGHALRSFLYSIAAVQSGCGDMFVFRNKAGHILALTYFLYDQDTAIYQGIVRDMDNPITNIGPYTLAMCSEAYCAVDSINYMDPTVETHVGQPDSVDSYKRKLINTMAWRPTLYVNMTGEDDEYGKPPIVKLGQAFRGKKVHYYNPLEDEG